MFSSREHAFCHAGACHRQPFIKTGKRFSGGIGLTLAFARFPATTLAEQWIPAINAGWRS